MALIEKTAFECKVTGNEFNGIANVAGQFQTAAGAAEICSAGFLCTIKGPLPGEGYTGINNMNAYIFQAAAAPGVDDVVYACNTGNVNMVTGVGGNNYKIGANTLGLPIPAGETGNFTEIDFKANTKIYRFGVGNLSTALGTNKFFTVANGLLVPAAAAPTAAGSVYFELVDTGTFTEGPWAAFGYVDVKARAVLKPAASGN